MIFIQTLCCFLFVCLFFYSDPKYQHSLGELLLTKNTAIIVEAARVVSLPTLPTAHSPTHTREAIHS